VAYANRTDYGTGVEHDVDTASCSIHSVNDDGEIVITTPASAERVKTSGQPIDLLAALQRSIDAAKSDRRSTPEVQR
jgi:non-homologous end joining protein Ku